MTDATAKRLAEKHGMTIQKWPDFLAADLSEYPDIIKTRCRVFVKVPGEFRNRICSGPTWEHAFTEAGVL